MQKPVGAVHLEQPAEEVAVEQGAPGGGGGGGGAATAGWAGQCLRLRWRSRLSLRLSRRSRLPLIHISLRWLSLSCPTSTLSPCQHDGESCTALRRGSVLDYCHDLPNWKWVAEARIANLNNVNELINEIMM